MSVYVLACSARTIMQQPQARGLKSCLPLRHLYRGQMYNDDGAKDFMKKVFGKRCVSCAGAGGAQPNALDGLQLRKIHYLPALGRLAGFESPGVVLLHAAAATRCVLARQAWLVSLHWFTYRKHGPASPPPTPTCH